MSLADPETLRARWLTDQGRLLRAAVWAALKSRQTPDWRRLLSDLPHRDEIGDNPLDLRGIDLSGASMPGTVLSGTRLDFAILDRAELVRADLSGATLARASVRETRLADAILRAANAYGADFEAATLARADLSFGNFARSSFRLAMLAGAHLRASTFAGANLRGADLTGADRLFCDFEDARLAGLRRERPKPTSIDRRDAVESAGFPSFRELLPCHLRLLLRPPIEDLLDIEVSVEVSTAPAMEVASLLSAGNWRLDLIAASALILGAPVTPFVLKSAWDRLVQSWASPQLAVALFLVDGEFDSKAQSLVRQPELRAKTLGALLALSRSGTPTPSSHAEIDMGRSLALNWMDAVQARSPERCRARWVGKYP